MSRTNTSTTNRLSRRRTYRRLMFGCIAVAVALGLALRFFDRPLLGEAVYWIGILAFFGIWFGTSGSLFDERDRALERRASQVTMLVAAAVLVVGASTARLVTALDLYEVPPMISGALYGYVALFAVFGVAYAWLRSRS